MRQEGIARLSELKTGRSARDFLVMHFLVQDLQQAISRYAGGAVLDVGCGNKPYEPFFTGKISAYTGCDVVQSDKHKVDVICPATELSFNNEMFDTVFTTQVIEHVGDPAKMLSEANRVLRPNGHIILSAPFCWELHEEPYDFYRYSRYGLKAMLEKAGFEVIDIRANGGKWAAIIQLRLNIIYSSFRSKGIFAKLLKLFFTKLGFTTLYNSMGLWLDKKFYDELLTLNYVAVAKKIRAAS
jgi:SAM-dependent methyltransferase